MTDNPNFSDTIKPSEEFYASLREHLGLSGFVKHLEVSISFDDLNLTDGITIYTPTIGDWLIDGWVEIITAWDGTTPLGDMGTNGSGLINANNNYFKMDSADNLGDVSYGGAGVLNGDYTGNLTNPTLAQVANYLGYRLVPLKFVTIDPLQFWVSQNGQAGGDDPASAQGSATVHLLAVQA